MDMTIPIPPPPPTQALTSSTFKQPPLDGTLTIPEIFDWHLHNSTTHPLFVYADENAEEHVILWPSVVQAVHRAGRRIQGLVKKSTDGPCVVAVLTSSDTITYFTTLVGIVRAGYTAFPISTRNSPAAIAHLLQKTNASHILVGFDSALQSLINEAFTLLPGMKRPSTSPMLHFDDIYKSDGETFEPLPPIHFQLQDPAVILHSSGSTAFPKPIVWTHYRYVQVGLTPCMYFGEVDLSGCRLALHSMPMFHGMGMMQTAWTAMSGLVISTFEPRSPAIVAEPDNVIKAAMNTKCDIIFCVPSFIETWSQNRGYVDFLKSTKGVLYGGGPLGKLIGDELWNERVKIFILYGCTEVGIMSPIIPEKSEKDWEYFRIAGNMKPKFITNEEGNSELVILPNPFELPCVFNTKIDGQVAYATSDLLAPHPTRPGYWKVFGRVDDQIMHSTGEKTNPGPLENILNQDPHVLSAVMFGRGRFYPGVLVDPKDQLKFDPKNGEGALIEFRNLIWPTVERMNAYAPQHSRIFKEMIIVSSPKKPFTYTAKNTVRRQAVINDYDVEIDFTYSAVQKSTQPHISLPEKWTHVSLLNFVRTVVFEVLKLSIGDPDDIFEKGCDSLQATWIRNTLLHAVEKLSAVDPRAIPGSFVYQHPSISSLASYLLNVSTNQQNPSRIDPYKIKEMEGMAVRYGKNYQNRSEMEVRKEDVIQKEEVVLLTGTTGWLGSLILAELLRSDVKRVYAVNRRGTQLIDRQVLAFKERGIDVSQALSEKLVLLEAELTEASFGIDKSLLNEIHGSVTHIIHNAFPVDFNKSLPSFESAIVSLRNLIDFALASPLRLTPRFVFISSVSSVNQHPGCDPVKEDFADAQSAIGSGYSESKWVCETILKDASLNSDLKSTVIRVGQLSGMVTSGRWNTKEWVPALFKSSRHLGCLPLIDNDVSWIPIDIAARAICEMRNSECRVLHLAHPSPVAWTSIFSAASKELGIPLVPYVEWVDKLERSANGSNTEQLVELLERNPALRILDFFKGCRQFIEDRASREAMGMRRLDISRACSASRSLSGELAPLSAESVASWIKYWKSVDFLSS